MSRSDSRQLAWCHSKTAFDLQATLKRYQAEHKNKLDSLEKSQAELKKIRRKSQGGRNAQKYESKETEVSFSAIFSFVSHCMYSLRGGILQSTIPYHSLCATAKVKYKHSTLSMVAHASNPSPLKAELEGT